MNTFKYARYLMNSLEADIQSYKAAVCGGSEFNRVFFLGSVKARMLALATARKNWIKFPASLQLEASKLQRYAESALNE